MTDSYLRCAEHSHVMELLGQIHGKLEEMSERQIAMQESNEKMAEKIEKLTKCGQDRQRETDIIKTKLTPIFWAIGVAVAAIIAGIIEHIARGR